MKEKRKSLYSRLLWLLFLGLFCLAGLSGCGNAAQQAASKTEKEVQGEKEAGASEEADAIREKADAKGKENISGEQENGTKSLKTGKNCLEVHYIDVGQGDATLILQDGHAMLIDAGNNNQGTHLQAYFQSLGIKEFDYVVGTHPDADHIGGLDVILYKFDCGKVIMADSEKETRTYEDVVISLQSKDMKNQEPVAGEKYSLGDVEFTIVSPVGKEYDSSNSSSVGILLQYGNTRFLFTGDAEEDAEEEMLRSGISLKADVYKAAHHGSDTANSEAFLKAVSPEYAVISCGEGNSYGHPHAEVLNNFRKMNIKTFRTDEQGTIVAVSDGENITFNMSPSESYQAGERTQAYSGEEDQTAAGSDKKDASVMSISPQKKTTYILNTNTKRFHLPDCYSVKEIKEENMEEREATAKELQKEGYQGCGNCIGRGQG